jgi:nitrate reductase gamma subunit
VARWLLTIGAVLACLFGAMLMLAPAPFFAPIGIEVTDKVATIAQNQGAALIAIGVIDFLARRVTDRAALRAVLWGNVVVQMLSLAVAVRALALGIFPPKGAPSVVIHVVLGVLFAIALRRPPVAAPDRG